MDRLSLSELEKEASRPCPYFWTGARPSDQNPQPGTRSAMAQAALDNSRKRKKKNGNDASKPAD